MLCWRRISAIGTPASPCFRISTIWLSVNRDFRMGISLAPESLRSKCLPKGEAYDAANGGPLATSIRAQTPARALGRTAAGRAKSAPISLDPVSTTMTGAKEVEDGREKADGDSWE